MLFLWRFLLTDAVDFHDCPVVVTGYQFECSVHGQADYRGTEFQRDDFRLLALQQQVKVAVRLQLLLADTHGLQTGPINIFYIIIIRDVPIRIHTVWGFDVCKIHFVSL